MSRALEILGFLTLSLAAHAALLGWAPDAGGQQSQGEGGSQLVSLSASSAALESLVETWDDFAPPEVQATAPAQETPVPTESAPDLAAMTPLPLEAPKMAVNLSPPTVATEPFDAPEAPEQPPHPEPPKASAPPKSQQSAEAAGQKAAGTGGMGAQGVAGTAQTATVDPGRAQRDLSNWGSTLRAAIERKKRYPSEARGTQGSVLLRISVARNGALSGVSVLRSSGNGLLDQAALRAVQSVGQFKPAPASLTRPSYTFDLKISFSPR
ncbi:TonB family protein [Celeribacter sp. SCSIO 80788]|uniref:energy transducer TonB n=1 Tax=Celeribacter sp. SCSIO 80788 TaxID=3117013 RepID=UPI003DA4EF95